LSYPLVPKKRDLFLQPAAQVHFPVPSTFSF